MAKCIRCGKSTIVRGHVKLADAAICTLCFKSLGFKQNDTLTASLYKYEDIKDGRDAYYQNRLKERLADAAKDSWTVKMTGGERDTVCTEEERAIYNRIVTILARAGLDTEPVRLTRKSDNYVSAVMDSGSEYGAMDIARIKYTNRAKWIVICPKSERIPLQSFEDVDELADRIIEAYEFNQPYL